mgnify:CR=1 FL=1
MAKTRQSRFYSRTVKPKLPESAVARRKNFDKHYGGVKRAVQQKWLPFLHVLSSLKPEQRVVLLGHLDHYTRDTLYDLVTRILSSKKLPLQKQIFLRNQIESGCRDHFVKKNVMDALFKNKKSGITKRQALYQIGGGAMAHVLRTAVPMLLSIYR